MENFMLRFMQASPAEDRKVIQEAIQHYSDSIIIGIGGIPAFDKSFVLAALRATANAIETHCNPPEVELAKAILGDVATVSAMVTKKGDPHAT